MVLNFDLKFKRNVVPNRLIISEFVSWDITLEIYNLFVNSTNSFQKYVPFPQKLIY